MARIGEYWREGDEWIVVTDEVRAIYDEPPSYVHIQRRFKTMKEAMRNVSERVRAGIRRFARRLATEKRERLARERLVAEREAKLRQLTSGLVKTGLTGYIPEGAKKVLEQHDWDPTKATGLNTLQVWEDEKGRRVVVLAWGNARYYWLHPDFVSAAMEAKWSAVIKYRCKRYGESKTLAIAREGWKTLITAKCYTDTNDAAFAKWVVENKLDEILAALRQCKVCINPLCCGAEKETELAEFYGLELVPKAEKHGVYLK